MPSILADPTNFLHSSLGTLFTLIGPITGPLFALYFAMAQLLMWFVGVTVVVCMAWKHAFGRGPLERLRPVLSMRAAGPEPEASHADKGTA